MSEAQRLRESAAMVHHLAEQQTTLDLRAHLMKTARDWRRMAEKAEEAEAAETASISSQAA